MLLINLLLAFLLILSLELQTCERRSSVMGAHEANSLIESRQLPLQLLSNHLDASELQRSVR